jgi:hypothetical protein
VHTPRVIVVADASAADLVRVQAAAPKSKADDEAPAAAGTPDKPGARVDAEISIGDKGIVIKRRRGDRDAEALADPHDFDSFEQFVEQAPWLAGLVFMVTAFVFLVPLLIIVLVIWYKMRTNRLRNETMLKLAERGVVAPGAAIDAVAASPASTALETTPATAPLYEQAKQVRRRAAWSDLRKAVILGGIGLGLTLYSMFEEGSANALGLVLLFVGIGYGFLWHFEDRQIGARRAGATPDEPRGGA